MKRWIPETIGGVLAAMLVSDLTYRWAIVPRLPTVRAVPEGWWAAMCAPLLGAYVVLALRTASWRELCWRSGAAAFVQLLWGVGATLGHAPGTHKSWFWEAPGLFWALAPIASFLLAFGALAIAYALRTNLGRHRDRAA